MISIRLYRALTGLVLLLAAGGASGGCCREVTLAAAPKCWFVLRDGRTAKDCTLARSVTLCLDRGGRFCDRSGRRIEPVVTLFEEARELRIGSDGRVSVRTADDPDWMDIGYLQWFRSDQAFDGTLPENWESLGTFVQPGDEGVAALQETIVPVRCLTRIEPRAADR